MKLLLMVTAVFEGATGLSLLIVPSMTVSTLLGAELDAPAALVAGRIAGAAIFSLAIACWQARGGEGGSPSTGVVAAMLFYNIAAAMTVVYAGLGLGLQSSLMWPVVVIHNVLAVWCAIVLWNTRRKVSTTGSAQNIDG